jgi:hypothetical protein
MAVVEQEVVAVVLVIKTVVVSGEELNQLIGLDKRL